MKAICKQFTSNVDYTKMRSALEANKLEFKVKKFTQMAKEKKSHDTHGDHAKHHQMLEETHIEC